MQQIGLGDDLEEFHGEMQRAGNAAGSILDVAGLRLGERDELLDVVDRQRRIDRERVRAGDEHRNRSERLVRIVGQLVERGLRRVGDRNDKRVWPSGGALATISLATTPPAPGLFSTMNCLPSFSEMCADDAGGDVVDAARRERHDDPHRLARIVVGPNCRRCHHARTKSRERTSVPSGCAPSKSSPLRFGKHAFAAAAITTRQMKHL